LTESATSATETATSRTIRTICAALPLSLSPDSGLVLELLPLPSVVEEYGVEAKVEFPV
jgi:hypothetical protein